MQPLSALLISSFNLGNFARYLENDEDSPSVTYKSAPFGQVIPALLDPPVTDARPDLAVVWTGPEQISPTFNRCLENEDFELQAIFHEVDQFSAALRSFCGQVNLAFVPTWVPLLDRPGSMLLGMRSREGCSRVLLEMNLRLAENLQDISNLHLLDSTRWMESGDSQPRDPKLWYMAKIPFANSVFQAAVADLKACLRGIRGRARKLILLDLDDTLWGGLVGDIGWEKLRLGGHDPAGEGYVGFQQALKALTRKGFVLGIISKNEANIALEAIDRHPEMILRREDFVGWRINREDKARNIVELVHELNLGIDSVVFIDDSPVERARVREALPEVLVPEWRSDSMLYCRALAELKCFEVPAVTTEDAMRTKMYVSERSRSELLERIGSVDDWLKSIEIRVEVEGVGNGNFDRALQILNRTNQMNMATRRFDALEFRNWIEAGDRKSWCFRVSDRLGDSGIAGLLSIEHLNGVAEIRDFVLSCRVMGRKVEQTMLHVAIDYARAVGLQEVRAKYQPTPRNETCLEFLKRAGFPARDGQTFIWYTKDEYPVPDAVTCSRVLD